MAKEDYLLKLSMLEQEANKLQEQLQIISQQVQEFEILKGSLDKFDKLKEGKEMLASLGKGIFFKSEMKDKKLFVNVGSGIVLRKSSQETVKIIDKQVKQLQELREQLEKEIEKINLQLQGLVEEARKEKA